MTLPKHFINHRLSDLNISKSEILIGISLGVFTAFIFYAFCNVFIDVFRFLVIDEENDSWFLSEDQRFFFNLFYAYFSSIFGQSISLNYLLHKSKIVFKRKKFRLMDVRANLNFTIWNTMHWFGQAALGYGIFYFYFFYKLELYPEFNYFFILLLLSLFLISWNPFLQIFKRQAYKVIISSAVLISAMAFGLSHVNITNRFGIEKELEKYSIHYQYKYEKIESEYFRFIRSDLNENLYVVFSKDTNVSKPVLVSNNKEIKLDSIQSFVLKSRGTRDEADRKFLNINLCIDKDVPMSFVNKIKMEIALVSQYKMSYAVIPLNSEYSNKIYSHCVVNIKNPPLNLAKFIASPEPKTPYKILDRTNPESDLVMIQHISDTLFNVEDKVIGLSELRSFYKKMMELNERRIFVFIINEKLNYEHYLRATIANLLGNMDAKNDYVMQKYGRAYNELEYDAQRVVNQNIRNSYLEIYPELLEEVIRQGDLSQEDFDFYYPNYN